MAVVELQSAELKRCAGHLTICTGSAPCRSRLCVEYKWPTKHLDPVCREPEVVPLCPRQFKPEIWGVGVVVFVLFLSVYNVLQSFCYGHSFLNPSIDRADNCQSSWRVMWVGGVRVCVCMCVCVCLSLSLCEVGRGRGGGGGWGGGGRGRADNSGGAREFRVRSDGDITGRPQISYVAVELEVSSRLKRKRSVRRSRQMLIHPAVFALMVVTMVFQRR